MDDLQAVTRALVDNEKEHHVRFWSVGSSGVAIVYGSFVRARFRSNESGAYDLDAGFYDGRPETITGLLNSIRGA